MDQRLQIFSGSRTETSAESATATEATAATRVFLSIPDCTGRLRTVPRRAKLADPSIVMSWLKHLSSWRGRSRVLQIRTWLAAAMVLFLVGVVAMVFAATNPYTNEKAAERGEQQATVEDDAPAWTVTAAPREVPPSTQDYSVGVIAPPRDLSNDATANEPTVVDASRPEYRTSQRPTAPVTNETVSPRMPWIRLDGTIK